MRPVSLFVTSVLLLAQVSLAQWSHRYAAVDTFGHQVYLEGFDLPILNAGPMDAAPSPNGRSIAFSARGWIWSLEIETGIARRLTSAAGVDARPSWSSDSRRLVFVRDAGRELAIVALDLDDGTERVLVDVDAIHLDPVFTAGGQSVVYASAEGGAFGVWRVDLETLERERLTGPDEGSRRYIDRRPQLISADRLVLLNKDSTRDAIVLLDLETGERVTLAEDRITSQADLALAPGGRLIAYTWPADGHHELRLMSVDHPSTSVLLTRSEGMPLAPAFSHDGAWIYFSEADDEEILELKKVPVAGGEVQRVEVHEMDWGAPTGTILVRTTIDGQPTPVRLSARDAVGHPVIPAQGAVRSEAQWDNVFFYSDGVLTLRAPAGEVTLKAVHGFETPLATKTVSVTPGTETTVTIELDRVWDASANGWYAADTHFHLNYGGPYRLAPDDMVPVMRGEGVDVGIPLLANLHNRFLEQNLRTWDRDQRPLIQFGQEVRSHFLGHVGLLGTGDFFWPWIWGPGYEVYAQDDRVNAAPLRHARAQGRLGGYVHPVSIADPFEDGAFSSIPIGFVADAVLGEVDLIEVVCLWTDEVGTAALWHQILNLGVPITPSAGSDVMIDYYRTMAIGAARVYVRPEGDLDMESFTKALGSGRSFVTNGPLIEFNVDGQGPGEVVAEQGTVTWSLGVASALPVQRVELFVNGQIVQTVDVQTFAGNSTFQGQLEVPSGGWVTARVTGENTGWPALDSALYAETSPVWFGAVGSIEPAAARASAELLLTALDAAQERLVAGYGHAEIPKLLAHFAAARQKLREVLAP